MTDNSRPTADIPAMPDFQSDEPPASSAPEPVTVTPAAPSSEVDYGLLDSFKAGQAGVTDATQKFVQQLGAFLSKALEDATSLDVRTYVSEDIGAVTYDKVKDEFGGNARLRARTYIKIDGDTLVCVPEADGEVDTAVWAIHMDMVRQAQESRTELMKTIVSAAGSLAGLIAPKA